MADFIGVFFFIFIFIFYFSGFPLWLSALLLIPAPTPPTLFSRAVNHAVALEDPQPHLRPGLAPVPCLRHPSWTHPVRSFFSFFTELI